MKNIGSCYDEDLIKYLKDIGFINYRIIPQPSKTVETIARDFPVKHGRVYLDGLREERYIKSSESTLATDTAYLVNELIQTGICRADEKVIYIGDNLIENEYEFSLSDLQKFLPYLIDNIPQHHYFLFDCETKLIFVSFESEIQFGIAQHTV